MENLHISIEQTTQTLRQAVAQCWESVSMVDRPAILAEKAGEVLAALSTPGDHAYDLFSHEKIQITGQDRFTVCYLNYQWAEQAKAFLILWRDVIFEIQKALILQSEGSVSKEALQKLDESSGVALSTAAEELMGNLDHGLQIYNNRRVAADKMASRWKLQKNPWPVYKQQMEQLVEQCNSLVKRYEELDTSSVVFNEIRLQTTALLVACKEELTTAAMLDEKAAAILEEYSEHPGKIAAAIEDLAEQLDLKQHLNIYGEALGGLYDRLPGQTQVCIGVLGGKLQVSDVLIKKRTRQWLDSEILPLLYEIWELAESAANGMKMALVNIRNRASLMSSDSKEVKPSETVKIDLQQPLRFFKNNLEKTSSEMSLLSHLVSKRMETSFRLSYIFKYGDDFLPVPLQSTIDQFSLRQNKWVRRLKDWYLTKTDFLRNLLRNVEQEEKLSIPEKAARYINARSGDPANAPYANIFITKGYIGESFAVGRVEELEHFGRLVENWSVGFRGAVCVTGRRFAGKSLFGEVAAHRFFPGNTIRISPYEPVNVKGRKMDPTFDLAECLQFVKKYNLNARPLVWIDDLELWSSPDIPLTRNVRSLIEFMDDHAGSIFFMVSMSTWLKKHLETFLDFDKVFQGAIKLDRMKPEDVRQAILIRHGATHKKLVDEERNPLSPKEFNKITTAIYRMTGGNIGEALSHWSCSIWVLDDDYVVSRFSPKYSLPDFLNPETALLLSSVMLQKRTNEYRLRKLLGPSFSERYVNVLQRLVSMGILMRQPDDWLEMNDLVANGTGQLLEQKGYLTGNDR